MKTTIAKWAIGIVTIMFVFASSALADGKRGRGNEGPGHKYSHRHDKGGDQDYRHGGSDKYYKGHHKRHRGPDRRYQGHRKHHRGDSWHYHGNRRHHHGQKNWHRGHHYKERHRHIAPRRHYRLHAKAYRGDLYPNPLFWLFPFPPNKPFVHK